MFGFWERLLIDKNQFKTKEVEQSISEKMIFALGN